MDATSEGEVDPAIPQSGRPAREKDVEAFRTISEVADDLRLPQHVLRFWETRFSQLRPLKRAGGRRYYRPGDVALLRTIRDLLHNEGYTIKGVQRLLRERRSPRGTASDPAIGEAGEMLSEDAPTDLVDSPVADAEYASDVGAPSLAHHTASAAGPDARLAAEPVAAIAQALRVIEECERLLRVALSAGS